ncbi:hypothetical protein PybrP1_007562 [[Pythium] brassicae (nom. inval.)]|nr:hypothetical protein PybrP1_007562 [[Pythium] brassicae (nom. inval.)]
MDATTRAVQNAQAIANAVRSVIASANASRPKNTRKNYDAKAIERTGWCTERQFMDDSLVNEGKLLLFTTEVVERGGIGRSLMVLCSSYQGRAWRAT